MEAFDFRAWMDQLSMPIDHAVKVFAVSRRTVIRWRVSGVIPATAAQLCRSIDRQAAPYSHSFGRGWQVGLSTLPHAWRVDLFGPDYRRVMSPAERQRRADSAAAVAAIRERAHAADDARRAARSAAMRQRHADRKKAGTRPA